MSKKISILIFIVYLSVLGLQAWTDHTLGTYPTLANMPEIKDAKPVQVESFEDFLKKERKKSNRIKAESTTEASKKNFISLAIRLPVASNHA